jgi:hypothetical protein
MDRFEFSRFNKPEDNTLRWSCPDDALPKPVATVPASIPPAPTITIPVLALISLALAVVNFLVLRHSKSPARWILPATFLVVAVLVIPIKPLLLPHPFQQPAELPPDTATDVFRQLHAGMYRALDFGSEDRIYDALDATIDGPLLEELYLQLQESLRVREQGGAIARIKAITFTEATPIPRTESASTTPWPAFALRATWQVAGTVEHWGHVHERENQFEAVFSIKPINNNWKITRMDILGQQQKSARTTLRRF